MKPRGFRGYPKSKTQPFSCSQSACGSLNLSDFDSPIAQLPTSWRPLFLLCPKCRHFQKEHLFQTSPACQNCDMPWLSFFSFFFCSKKTLFLSLSSFLHFDFVCYAMVHSSDSATSYPHLEVMQLYIKGARPELMIMNHFIFAVYFCLFASVTAEGEKSQGLTGI